MGIGVRGPEGGGMDSDGGIKLRSCTDDASKRESNSRRSKS